MSPVKRAKPLGPLASKTESVTSFAGLCGTIRERVQAFESYILTECISLGDLFAEAKKMYEAQTGTGHGHRNPEGIPAFAEVMAKEIRRSPSYVWHYLQISKLDVGTRGLILSGKRPEIARSITMLCALVREPDIEVRAEALKAHDEGGTKAFEQVLKEEPPVVEAAKKDPAVQKLLKELLDPSTALGGLTPETPIPPELVAMHESLQSFRTIGDLRRAAVREKPKPPRELASFREEHTLGVRATEVGVFIGSEGERVRLECGSGHTIEVLEVTVPWKAIEALLQERERLQREVSDPEFVADYGPIEAPSAVTITEGSVRIKFTDLGRQVRGVKRSRGR